MFELSRTSSVPLVDQIVERITKLTRHGQLPAGARIPSIRKLAKLVGASPFTVVDAYDRLVARGGHRVARGSWVLRHRDGKSRPRCPSSKSPRINSGAVALAERIARTLASSGDVIAAGSGFLPTAWYAEALPRMC